MARQSLLGLIHRITDTDSEKIRKGVLRAHDSWEEEYWLEGLQYTERLLQILEDDIEVLADRLDDLAKFKGEAGNVLEVTERDRQRTEMTTLTKGETASTSISKPEKGNVIVRAFRKGIRFEKLKLTGRQPVAPAVLERKSKQELIDALAYALATWNRKKEVRADCLAELDRVLREARKADLIV